jgi:hypothetical protein
MSNLTCVGKVGKFVNIAELVGNTDMEGLVTNEVGRGPVCNSQAQAHILGLLPTQKTLTNSTGGPCFAKKKTINEAALGSLIIALLLQHLEIVPILVLIIPLNSSTIGLIMPTS